MSAIKDLIDLTIELSNSVNDRKIASEILKIQSLISTIQHDNASILSENLELKEKNSELKKEIINFQNINSQEKTKITDKYVFIKSYGIYKSNKPNPSHYFCTSCLLNNIESPLTESKNGWLCQLKQCGKFYPNPSYTPPKDDLSCELIM